MTTIYDVAKELNLNPSTVSRAFKNPEMVSEKTRKRIMEAAERLGYYPNLVASQLRTNSSNLIGIIMVGRRKLWNWYSDSFMSGAQEVAIENGYKVLMMDSNVDSYKSSVELYAKMRFAGIVLASTEILDIDCQFSSLLPIVFVNQSNCNGVNILPADYKDLRVEMEYLIKLGHRKIACINGRKDSPHTIERFQAYNDVMRENNLEINPEWIGRCEDWMPKIAYKETTRMLSTSDRPTAIIASDSMCPGVYDAARNLGLRVPNDISVAGYDNQELTGLLYPPLTTVSFPLYEMGCESINQLIELIKNKGDKKNLNKNSYVRGELIVRKSVLNLA